jgi:hypothetical protein
MVHLQIHKILTPQKKKKKKKKKPVPLGVISYSSLPQPLAIMNLLYISMDLPILDIFT